ncbi:YdeI/OmpD-associated family protein [Amycolatopsis sp. cg5]|uniref:YdeI/OmpD-associated family protein n=1 Tax=Amycolatopsis sp. cg5 TaxID=3238802 RepID=UPI0035260C49
MTTRRFAATVRAGARGRVFVPVPFDPDQVWGSKPRHHVTGTVNEIRIRGVVEKFGADLGVVLGAAWRRDNGLAPGDHVEVALAPEGPQRDDLADDIASALDANPAAAAFFDSLAQFYRRAYLRWVDGTKNRPELRATRIAEMIDLLAAGLKERPKA